jgi:hypothetical protein
VKEFVARFRPSINATLSGFDRLVFRGWLLPLMGRFGMFLFLKGVGVRLLDFKQYAVETTEYVKKVSLLEAERRKRPVIYLERPTTDKESLGRKLLREHPVEKGLICMFKALEPCLTFEYHRSQDRQERGLRLQPGKCLHLYKYYMHPHFGFMNARLQTWFPFNIQICLNGREWLARQLEREGRSFKRNDNCFTWFDNAELAQRRMDKQLETDWPQVLDAIARLLHPAQTKIFERMPMSYYWTAYQTEWATDVMFENPCSLAGIYPALTRHAMLHFQSPDVMRFLAQKAHGNFTGEVVTSFKDRAEGVRVKHWVRGNSVKMYDKAGSVLRVETTIGDTTDFKVLRPRHESGGDGPASTLAWRPLRKGVADLHRRAQVSQRANDSYLDALAEVNDDTPTGNIFDAVSHRVTYSGRHVRALRIGDANDLALLKAVTRGEFAVAGMRNRDLRSILYPNNAKLTEVEGRRLSGRISRLLRILRAHHIIRKIPKSHRYRLTARGRLLTASIFAARTATVKTLRANAA